MVIAGGVLIATGVGGPVGMMLVAAGADTIIQKATTGHVDWEEVAVSGVLGGVGGGAALATKAGLTGIKATIAAGAYTGAITGAGTGAYTYSRAPGPAHRRRLPHRHRSRRRLRRRPRRRRRRSRPRRSHPAQVNS